MIDQEGQWNTLPTNAFTDTSPETQGFLNDISKVIGGRQNKSSLTTHMQNAAKAAGMAARGAKTIESEQEIYKQHLSHASKISNSKAHAPMTSGDVISWERLAKQTRNAR